MRTKKILLTFAILIFCIGVTTIFNSNNSDVKEYETNHAGLVMLGLAPNTDSRDPTELDIDTGLRIKYKESDYILYESRTWDKLDYGKTFVVKVK